MGINLDLKPMGSLKTVFETVLRFAHFWIALIGYLSPSPPLSLHFRDNAYLTAQPRGQRSTLNSPNHLRHAVI